MAEFFRTIKPGVFQPKAIEDALRAAQRRWMMEVLAEFNKTTRGWKHRVDFSASLEEKGIASIIEVTTDSDIYRYVDEGTKPHKIYAGIYTGKSNKKALAFPSISVPKTKPGSLTVGKGSSGGSTVLAAHVDHPGTKARDFTEQIRKKMEPVLVKSLQKAMDEGARKSGHGI